MMIFNVSEQCPPLKPHLTSFFRVPWLKLHPKYHAEIVLTLCQQRRAARRVSICKIWIGQMDLLQIK